MERKEVNINDVSPMMREYLKTKEKYEDEILFYRLGDFYEMFFDDALTASHVLELTLTGKTAGLKERIPMCGVPYHSADIYIARLLEKGYKVAVCEQVEDPKTTKGIVKREVTRVVSPGTITNNELTNEKDNNYIASLIDYKYIYTITYADILTGKVFTTFIAHEENKLISKLINLNIKELILTKDFNIALRNKLKSNYGIFITIFNDDKEYSNKKVFENISDSKLINCSSLLLNYLTYTQMRTLDHIQKIEYVDSKMFLELDKEAIRNLELIETLKNKERTNSLLWLMDKTKTAMGSRLLKNFIISPSLNKEEIEKRHNLTQKLINEFIIKSELRDLLYEIYDLERLTGKVSCGNINPRDLIQLKNSIKVLPNLNKLLVNLDLEELNTFEDLYQLLDESISEDAPLAVKEGSIIKEGYDSELDELRSIRKNGKDFISKFENDERERTGIKNLKVGYNKVFGYYIEISKGQLHLVKDEFNYDRKQTISNCERFTTPLLKEKENMILGAEDKINTIEYNLFINIREKIKEYISSLQNVSSNIAYLDVLQSFATVAEENKFVKPLINNDGTIEIIEGRHPVVETVISEEYIPNDVIMDKSTNILIITGPNMSGKSTFMRELGIIAVLNQIGSFVPAKKASLPIFDKVFTRIGASDDLTSGDSTFMVEMKESANALKNATEKSLILFDELGRGTSTFDGMSLAGSIIEYIANNIKCKTLFSTHYHELTDLESKIYGIKNVHVSIDEKEGDIKFLHKVMDGAVDKSYGINVAKLAGLPNEVIKKANELLQEYENIDKNKTHKRVKQLQLDLTENYDELREYIKKIDPLDITPMESINILYEIKKKSEV